MNILVHAIWWIYTFISLGYVLKVELLVCGCRYNFTFVRNC